MSSVCHHGPVKFRGPSALLAAPSPTPNPHTKHLQAVVTRNARLRRRVTLTLVAATGAIQPQVARLRRVRTRNLTQVNNQTPFSSSSSSASSWNCPWRRTHQRYRLQSQPAAPSLVVQSSQRHSCPPSRACFSRRRRLCMLQQPSPPHPTDNPHPQPTLHKPCPTSSPLQAISSYMDSVATAVPGITTAVKQTSKATAIMDVTVPAGPLGTAAALVLLEAAAVCGSRLTLALGTFSDGPTKIPKIDVNVVTAPRPPPRPLAPSRQLPPSLSPRPPPLPPPVQEAHGWGDPHFVVGAFWGAVLGKTSWAAGWMRRCAWPNGG